MSGVYENIYKTSRKKTDFTQESVAEKIGISVESVRAYETNQRIPPNEVVLLMVELYGDLALGYNHMADTNPLARRLYPKIEEKSLLEVAVRIFNRMQQLDENQSIERLLEIAEDGIVDATEQADFNAIVADMRELVSCGMELWIPSSVHRTS